MGLARGHLAARRGLALLTALAAIGAVPGAAHEGPSGVVAVLDDVAPPLDGVDAQIVPAVAPRIVLRWRSGPAFEVLDDEGEPFLRIGTDGVEADVGAPAWHSGNDPLGLLGERGREPARWLRVSDAPSWGWFDHRLHPVPVEASQPPDAEHRVLHLWRVPIRRAGTVHELRGRVLALAARLEPELFEAPAVTGLRLEVLPGTVPLLSLAWHGHGELLVLGRAGEPFLRFGPEGVAANAHSPSWHEQARLRGEPVTADADPQAAPQWRLLAPVPAYAWPEPRAAGPPPPLDLAHLPEAVRWQVPLRTPEGDILARGRTRWVPLDDPAAAGAGAVPWATGPGLAGIAAAVAAGLVLRARRARPHASA